jgi:NTE family protein
VGIALGAGGARGLAHIGVLRALMEADVRIDALVGTSSGALVGAMYAAGQLENFEARMRELQWNEVLALFDPVWPRSGLISGSRILDKLASTLGQWRIEDLAIPFAAVTVDLVTGDEIVIREGRVLDAIRASISIPGVFVPVAQNGRLLADGALCNPVPVSALADMGTDVCLAVNLFPRPVRELLPRPRGSGRRPLAARISQAIEPSLGRLFRRPRERPEMPPADDDLPNLLEILTASMTLVQHELARHRLAHEHVDVCITPEVDAIRTFDFHKAAPAIEAGRAATEAALPMIHRALRRPKLLRRTYRAGTAPARGTAQEYDSTPVVADGNGAAWRGEDVPSAPCGTAQEPAHTVAEHASEPATAEPGPPRTRRG